MKPGDWLSERMVFGILVIIGYLTLATLILTGYAASKGVSDTMQGVVLGAMGAGIPLILQATFRTDRVDKVNANTMATLASTAAATTPQAVTVTNPVSDPVNVQTTEGA